MYNFDALSNRNEHIEPKSSVKSVAADQIKRDCQNYWGGAGPPAPPHAKAPLWMQITETKWVTGFVQIFGSKIQDLFQTFFWQNNNFFFQTQGYLLSDQ